MAGEEYLVVMTVLGTAMPILSIITWQIFKERHETRKLEYNKWKARYDHKANVKAPTLARESKGIVDLIGGLDSDKIKGILGALQEPEFEDEPEGSDIGDLIANVVQNNPSLVQGFLSGISKKKEGDTNGDQKYL
jgi:hypothetical protein